MNTQKGFIPIIIIVVVLVTVTSIGAYFLALQTSPYSIINPGINPSPVACIQEVKQCPDGSYVSRTEPNCNFAECPKPNITPNPSEQCPPGTVQVGQTNSIPPSPICELKPSGYKGEYKVNLTEGQKEYPLLVEKIYTDYITGLNFPSYPVLYGQGHPITLRLGETASNGCTVTLTLIKIEGKTATFIKKTDDTKPCPICLAENTLIDTPSGQIAVQDLEKGMEVWTVDEYGARIASAIIETSKTPVPKTHQMIHVILEDGREIFVSPGHPVGDGRIFNNLSTGDMLDGSKIVTAKKTAYDKGHTYDILPSGSTGFYFANGILIGSTLK